MYTHVVIGIESGTGLHTALVCHLLLDSSTGLHTDGVQSFRAHVYSYYIVIGIVSGTGLHTALVCHLLLDSSTGLLFRILRGLFYTYSRNPYGA